MITAIERQTLAAYEAADRHIPDSDLDDEQPITLSVRTTLGEVRRIRRCQADRERGATERPHMSDKPFTVSQVDAVAIATKQRTAIEQSEWARHHTLAPADVWIKNRSAELMENGAEQCELDLIRN